MDTRVKELHANARKEEAELIKRIISTPKENLKPRERVLREIYDKNAYKRVYHSREFFDKVPGGTAGTAIQLTDSIDELLERYLSEGKITEKQKYYVLGIQQDFDARYAIDILDCEVMKTREWGSLYFKSRLS